VIVDSVTDNPFDHVAQPLSLAKNPLQPTSNVPALRPRQQPDGRQRLAQVVAQRTHRVETLRGYVG
jgi:hypothetical protein